MYKRNQSTKLHEAFWTTFGKYMAPVPSSEGMKINWVNYKTGVKDISFYMQADSKTASIGILLTQQDQVIREIFFQELEKLRSPFEQQMAEVWQWERDVRDENFKSYSRIFKQMSNANIYEPEQWPELISFLKPRLIALDHFWNEWKYGFEDLL